MREECLTQGHMAGRWSLAPQRPPPQATCFSGMSSPATAETHLGGRLVALGAKQLFLLRGSLSIPAPCSEPCQGSHHPTAFRHHRAQHQHQPPAVWRFRECGAGTAGGEDPPHVGSRLTDCVTFSKLLNPSVPRGCGPEQGPFLMLLH